MSRRISQESDGSGPGDDTDRDRDGMSEEDLSYDFVAESAGPTCDFFGGVGYQGS